MMKPRRLKGAPGVCVIEDGRYQILKLGPFGHLFGDRYDVRELAYNKGRGQTGPIPETDMISTALQDTPISLARSAEFMELGASPNKGMGANSASAFKSIS